MKINGQTQIIGIIGNPIGHTMSPVIHNTLSDLLGNNMVYVPFPAEDDVESLLRGAYALGIKGMNVTVPFKSAVIPYLQNIDPQADQIGAVNTLVRCEGGWKGYNTDLPGLYRALLCEGIEIAGKDVVIVGAGGAARAAAYLCAHKKAQTISILNRTLQNAVKIQEEIQQKTGYENIVSLPIDRYMDLKAKNYVVLQATKVGLYPNVLETPIMASDFFQKADAVYDLIYTPRETRFMQLAREQGKRAYHGLKMLLYQGILSYELWNSCSVSEDVIQNVYEALGKECV